MSILLLVRTDGRDDLLTQTIASAEEMLYGPIAHRVIHTDNGTEHAKKLQDWFPDYAIIGGERQGFGGAINRAWGIVADFYPDVRWVFTTEDDFLFERPVELDAMSEVMENHPYLSQMALVRNACNETESKAGGLLEAHADAFVQVAWNRFVWLEHREWFTTNPSLLTMERVAAGWPNIEHSEGTYSIELFKDPQAQSGYWGSLNDRPWIRHIGDKRNGVQY